MSTFESNVRILFGKSGKESSVFVNGVLVKGVVSAKYEQNEHSMPVATIKVLCPRIAIVGSAGREEIDEIMKCAAQIEGLEKE